jgi:hypothetical protein
MTDMNQILALGFPLFTAGVALSAGFVIRWFVTHKPVTTIETAEPAAEVRDEWRDELHRKLDEILETVATDRACHSPAYER